MTDVRWQIIAYVFVSIVLWMAAAQLGQRRMEMPWVRRLSQGWVASVLRFVYYIGLPYATLILGVMPGRYLGLVGLSRLPVGVSSHRNGALPQGAESTPDAWQSLSQIRDAILLVVLDWLPDVGTMIGLATIMLLVLSVTWLGYGRFKRGVAHGPGVGLSFSARPYKLHYGGLSERTLSQERTMPSAGRVACQAIHWSFYRGAAWLLLGDLYLGVMGGIVLVGVQWMLDPGWMAKMSRPLSAEEPLIDASLLIAVSVVFFFAPNLWLLMPVHWLLATVSRRMATLGEWRTAGSR